MANSHPLEELRARSASAAHDPVLVEFARQTPSAAYRSALVHTGSIRKAKATRFLSMILRDYGRMAFGETTKS